jgi:hypothetical protein
MVKIHNYREEFDHSHLKGFVDIEIEEIGIEIRGLSIHKVNGNSWVRMPVRTRENGKSSWIVYFKDLATWKHIESEILNLLKFDNGGGISYGAQN